MPEPKPHRHGSSTHQHASSSRPLRLAVIDTDSGFLQAFANRMQHLGWEHRTLRSAVPTCDLVAMRVDVLIADIALLGPVGPAYLERVSHELPDLSIIVCSGPSTVAQRVHGLRLGADDWLQKPCHTEELIARIEAVVRRRTLADARTRVPHIVAGEIDIQGNRFQAFAHGLSLDLTRREFEVLELLAGTAGRVLEREELYHRVWGYAMARGDRSIDVYVRKLRRKLQHASPGWHYIHTHFGVGYRFEPTLLDHTPPPARQPSPNTSARPTPTAHR